MAGMCIRRTCCVMYFMVACVCSNDEEADRDTRTASHSPILLLQETASAECGS